LDKLKPVGIRTKMVENLKAICFDYSHNNRLEIENTAYAEFIHFLFTSSYKVGKITTGITSEKLKPYDVLVLGSPYESFFTPNEIEIIIEFVKLGGGLFVIHDNGGDELNETNLDDITSTFGFKFNADTLYDSMNYVRQQNRPLISKFEKHYVTREVEEFVHASGCTLTVEELLSADSNIEIHTLARSGLNAFVQTRSRGDIDSPNVPVLVAINYFKGKVVGLGNLSILSSLSSTYGFNAYDNSVLISNIFNWLAYSLETNGLSYENKVISIPLNYALYIWLEKLIDKREWGTFSDVINFGLKYMKDNYDRVIEESKLTKKKLQDLKRKQKKDAKDKAKNMDKERKKSLEEIEDSLYDLFDNSEKNDKNKIDDIMNALKKYDEEEPET
jgi:Arc/MetJ-type ribon-helix-helix transcriptional regulator